MQWKTKVWNVEISATPVWLKTSSSFEVVAKLNSDFFLEDLGYIWRLVFVM